MRRNVTPGVYVRETPGGARTITGVGTSALAVVDWFPRGQIGRAVRVTSEADFERTYGGLHEHSAGSYAVRQFFANGGAEAWVVRVAGRPTGGATALIGSAARKDGLQALRHVAPNLFNLLIVPAAAELASDDARAVYAAATELCSDLRAFLLVDVPTDRTRDGDVVRWVDDLRSPGSAVFFPRVRVTDPLNAGQPKEIAPSGTVAGIFARTDSQRGVWKAPAGVEATLLGASPVEPVDDARAGSLNSAGINVLRTFPNHGSVVWGSRTTLGTDAVASEWKYVPVRRLALYIEESLVRGLDWAVFEPNDEPLWAQIRLTVGEFLETLFRQGAFQGTTARDAYRVACDSSTTTRKDIDDGVVNVLVMFAPLKPAEFVVLRIQQRAGRAKP